MYEQFKIVQIFPTDKIIANGTPLPEHHGDLVDRNSFEYLKTLNDAIHGKMSWSDAIHKIRESAPTIIPATKEGADYDYTKSSISQCPDDGATRTCNSCRFCENIEYTPWAYIITCHKRECQDYNLWENATKEGDEE